MCKMLVRHGVHILSYIYYHTYIIIHILSSEYLIDVKYTMWSFAKESYKRDYILQKRHMFEGAYISQIRIRFDFDRHADIG